VAKEVLLVLGNRIIEQHGDLLGVAEGLLMVQRDVDRCVSRILELFAADAASRLCASLQIALAKTTKPIFRHHLHDVV
jgi:hypothetical protein